MALAQGGTPLAQHFRASAHLATRAGRSAEWSHAIEVPYDRGCPLPMRASFDAGGTTHHPSVIDVRNLTRPAR